MDAPSQYEMYNITKDPLETKNLANPIYATAKTKQMEKILAYLLELDRKQKRLYPYLTNNE